MLKRVLVIATGGAAGAAMLALVSIRAGSLFGVGPRLDAYFVAVSLPSLLLALSASVITSVLTPRLSMLEPQLARRRAGEWALLIFLLASALATVIILCSNLIVTLIAPGLSASGARTATTVLRIMALALPETMATHVYSAYGYANGRVLAGGVSTAIYGLTWLALLFIAPFTHSVQGVAIACLLATQVQLATSFGLCARLQLAPWPRWRIPARPMVAITAGAAVLLALLMSKLNLLLDPIFGSFLNRGDVSELSYAYRIALLFVLMAGQGSALTLLAMAPAVKGGATTFHKRGIGITVLMGTGAAAAIAVCFRPVAPLILAHGSLGRSDALAVGGLVQAYAGLIAVMSIAWAFESAMYAANRVWAVAAMNVPVLALNIVLSALLVSIIGIYGRPIAVTLSMCLYVVLLIGAIQGRAGIGSLLRSLPLIHAVTLGAMVAATAFAVMRGGQAVTGDAAVWGLVGMGLAALLIVVYVRLWLVRMTRQVKSDNAMRPSTLGPTIGVG